MKSCVIILLLMATSVPAASGAEPAGMPSLTLSEVGFASGGSGPYVILVRPDGHGPPLTEARDLAGNPADATVEVFVRDSVGQGISAFPWQDAWIVDVGATGPSSCSFGNPVIGMTMDASADQDGRMVLAAPPVAGGWSDGDANAMLNAEFLQGNPLQLRWNSPDLNGDRRVNVSDAGMFTGDLAAGYHFRSDLVYDGVLNLSDVGVLADALGAGCR